LAYFDSAATMDKHISKGQDPVDPTLRAKPAYQSLKGLPKPNLQTIGVGDRTRGRLRPQELPDAIQVCSQNTGRNGKHTDDSACQTIKRTGQGAHYADDVQSHHPGTDVLDWRLRARRLYLESSIYH
jgi:hypothetical protein